MNELLLKHDSDDFGIEIYKTYLNLRWKKKNTQISYEAIKIIVNLIKSLNQKYVG